jgi:5S rRNA maturation endonuclease (ribonuclease M5)
MTDLKQLKQTLNNNIELVLSKLGIEYETLGDNIYAVCPIHQDSDNPRAFCFSKNKGIWKCWTRDCQHEYKNDIFGLICGAISAKNGTPTSFKDVLKWSYDALNIKNKNHSFKSVPEDKQNDWENIINILSPSVIENNNAILSLNEKLVSPSRYFLSRGFQEQTLSHFGVAECHTKSSCLYDRAIVPIHNENGELVSVIGRSIKEYKEPKFLIYPKGVNKSSLLYNYHRALDEIQKTNTIFVVEGQGDVWRLYEAGIHNAVGLFGKTISKDQENKLYSTPITHMVILTDNDQAGREAKTQIKRQFSRLYKLSFPTFKKKDIGEMSIAEIQNEILTQIKGL